MCVFRMLKKPLIRFGVIEYYANLKCSGINGDLLKLIESLF